MKVLSSRIELRSSLTFTSMALPYNWVYTSSPALEEKNGHSEREGGLCVARLLVVSICMKDPPYKSPWMFVNSKLRVCNERDM